MTLNPLDWGPWYLPFLLLGILVAALAIFLVLTSPPDHYCRDLKQLADQGNQLAQVQLVKDCR